jgi:hypothetical protein
LPRSSIVVSDEPLSRETNYRTEFVAVLSNQPQGGFITRKPTPKVRVAGPTPADEGFNPFFFFQRRDPPPDNSRWRGNESYRPQQRGWW